MSVDRFEGQAARSELDTHTEAISRRHFLAGAAAATGSTLLPATEGLAKEPEQHPGSSSREVYDKGLVPIQICTWYDAESSPALRPALGEDIEVDVAVVGAGLAGGSLTLHLAEAGVAVALLEAHQPGWGASGRSAGHVTPTFDLASASELPDGGKAYAKLFADEGAICFDLIRNYGIDCDAHQAGVLRAIQRENLFLERAQTTANHWIEALEAPVRILQAEEMKSLTGSDRYRAGILWEKGGRVNPWSLTNGIVAAAVGHGARVFGDSPATRVRRTGRRWVVDSVDGSVTADRVVFCTNGYTKGVLPELDRCYSPMLAYGLSTHPLPDELRAIIMPSGATMQQFPLNMHSLIVDGSGRIVTSLLPRTSSPEEAEPHFEDLIEWLHVTWPQSRDFEIELEGYWTGAMAFSSDGFPRLFQVDEGLLALMCFSGSGNVHAPLLGRHLAGGLVRDDLSSLALPISSPEEVWLPTAKSHLYRRVLVPLGRLAEDLSMI